MLVLLGIAVVVLGFIARINPLLVILIAAIVTGVTAAVAPGVDVRALAQAGVATLAAFGDDARQYYETIAGGSGAGPGFDGASAVQTHMTNSRLTDPEVLETRFPVLLEEFSIRRGSGGAGAARGGDGATRRVRFLEPMTAAILSGHRRIAPFGAAGGEPGGLGANRIERADGSVETLGSTAEISMAPGDVFVIQTPGGGGFGGK